MKSYQTLKRDSKFQEKMDISIFWISLTFQLKRSNLLKSKMGEKENFETLLNWASSRTDRKTSPNVRLNTIRK